MKIAITSVLAIGISLAGVRADAQTASPKGYLDLNVAGQIQDVTVATSTTFSLFGESGSTNFSQTVGKGLVFDGSAGYFVRRDFSIGVTVSLFTRSPEATVSVVTPDPIAFNSFTVLAASPKLKHTELGTHVRLAYHAQVGSKTEVVLFAGPSFMRLSKEVAVGSVTNGAPQIAVETQNGTGIGGHGGADVVYVFTPRLGAGIFVRYVAAQVNLPVASAVKVGGFQGGLGLRFRL